MAASDLIIDAFSALSHKAAIAVRGARGVVQSATAKAWVAPTWVGTHERRLTAYKLLESYYRNMAREWLDTADDEVRRDRREYGDAALLVNVVVAALLGEDPEIVVTGAEDEDDTAARERQQWLRDWASAEAERFTIKMLEAERDAHKLGDGVFVLGWSEDKRRPTLTVYDPGFYFPDLDPNQPGGFPRTVHIAWEYDQRFGDETRTMVRRTSWQLAAIQPEVDRFTGEFLVDDRGGFVLRPGDFLDTRTRARTIGRIVRKLPWNDEPTDVTCYMSDGIWDLRLLEKATVETLPSDQATWLVNDDGRLIRNLDIDVDFIPVVHVPCTVAGKEHFGTSLLANVAQILDDIHTADTDAVKGANLAAVPAVALSGATVSENLKVRPGALWNLGANGRMDVLDLSSALPALLDFAKDRRSLLSVNSRVPEEMLGRVKASEVASGVLLSMTFGPLRGLVAEERLVRDEKYPLILKFVQRFGLLAGEIAGEVLPAHVSLGKFLPTDRKALIDEVVAMYGAKLISRRTAIRLLVDGGIELGEVAEELEAVEHEDFEMAMQLLEATGDEDAVFEFLGREPPATRPIQPDEVPPTTVTPGTGTE